VTRGAGPNPIDQHVGARLRLRRKRLEISQTYLAKAVGLTFQQIQKYEQGSNRISASTLYEIAAFLEVPVGYFFEGLDGTRDTATKNHEEAVKRLAQRMVGEPDGKALAEAFLNFRRPYLRGRFVELARTIADTETGAVEVEDDRRRHGASPPPA
jgi:transcriptional regulator with XRE-family HTH domain